MSTTYSLHYLYSFCVIPHRFTFRLSQYSIQNGLFLNKNIKKICNSPALCTLSLSLTHTHTHTHMRMHTPLLFSQSKEPMSLQRLIGSSERWSSLTCLTSHSFCCSLCFSYSPWGHRHDRVTEHTHCFSHTVPLPFN